MLIVLHRPLYVVILNRIQERCEQIRDICTISKFSEKGKAFDCTITLGCLGNSPKSDKLFSHHKTAVHLSAVSGVTVLAVGTCSNPEGTRFW